MEKTVKKLLPIVLACSAAFATQFPEAEISSRVLKVKLLLPDPEHGYYRGSRFDWSGVISSLVYKGHEFFGQWFEHYDPFLNDAIMGPVEEFRGEDGALGYDEAKPGGYFVKIGVGVLRRADDSKYNFGGKYELVNPGHRIVDPEADRITFIHELNNGDGYSYVYRKVVRVEGNKPELIIEHSLRNVGRRVIETSVYNHDFYMLDHQPSGPDFRVKFTFAPKTTVDQLNGIAEFRGDELVYKRALQPGGEYVFATLNGFGDTAKDNAIIVENPKAGIGVREIGNRPLSLVNFWSIRSTVCPEAYIHMIVDPGKIFTWKITYRFYTLPTPK